MSAQPLLAAELYPTIPETAPRQPGMLPGLRLMRIVRSRSLLLPLALVLLFSLMPVLLFLQDPSAALSLRATRTVAGRVDRIEAGLRCDGKSTRLSYSFVLDDGVVYRDQVTVCSSSAYSSLQPGDSVPVVYVADEPSINEISGTQQGNAPPLVLIVVFPLFALLMFLPMLWPELSRILRDRKLFRGGRMATGSVLFVTRDLRQTWPGWPSSAASIVYLRVDQPAGIAEVQAQCGNEWLLAQLKPGAEVTVLFDPQKARAMLVENYLR